MKTNVLFGSYTDAGTPLHKLDARVKIICLLAATIAIFSIQQPLMLVVMAAIILALAWLAGISASQLASAAKPAFFILLLSLIFNTFAANSIVDIALIGTFGISTSGFIRGITAVARILMLVALALVLTTTTSSLDVADALNRLLMPLAWLDVPVNDIAMTVSVALRFIPLTAEELVRIRDAQRVRGVNFDEGSMVERLRKWLSVLTPLVVALFRNADDLAKAMRERCYTSKGRTHFTKNFAILDIVALVGFVALCVVVCLV